MGQLSFLGADDRTGSPIRRQYLDAKRRYPDAILLFRLGDFYETFDDDARILSTELEITLTAREMGKGEKVPLAGIPHHAAEGYIARLIAKGYKLAICEQLGTTPVRGLVPREIIRVITPGTLVEDSLLPTRSNNFLAATVRGPGGVGLAIADISTGEFAVTEIERDSWLEALTSELERLRPAECLLDPSQADDAALKAAIPQGCFVTTRGVPTPAMAERTLRDHFGVATLEGFGLGASPLATRSASVLLAYLKETQPAALRHLGSVRNYSIDRYMKLDSAARRHLELTANEVTGTVEGSLLSVLDGTRTPMGGRLLRSWIGQPLLEVRAIEDRLDVVEEMLGSALARTEAGSVLASVGDMERLASRAAQQTLSPRDCLGIARSLKGVPVLARTLERRLPRALASLSGPLDDCAEVRETIEGTIADDPAGQVGNGVIRKGKSRELDELRALTGNARQWIADLEKRERERTGVRSLRIGYNKVFGYYIEVTRPNLESSVDEYAKMTTGASRVSELLDALGYQRKQTIANGERFVTAELKEQELRLHNAEAEIEALEKQIYSELLAELSGAAQRLRTLAEKIAWLDALLSLAEAASSGRYVRPAIDESTDLEILAGRHPVVERSMPVGSYVPNDALLSGDERQIAVITGPNMAGKSTYVLQVALIALMAQIGSFVPATQARIGIVDRIFTRIGAQHDIAGGKSTFLVEMAETANVLNNATPRSLVVLDEVGRGTSTYDGMAIARAVVEYLHEEPRLRCRTLFATHYHELTELESAFRRVLNLRMEVVEKGGNVVFLHQVVPGGADRSYGIHVAQLAGIPSSVILRAREILSALEESRGGDLPAGASPPMAKGSGADARLSKELQRLDITRMTPLEALAKLDELRKKALGA